MATSPKPKWKPRPPAAKKHDHVGHIRWPQGAQSFGDEVMCELGEDACGQRWWWHPDRGWVVGRSSTSRR